MPYEKPHGNWCRLDYQPRCLLLCELLACFSQSGLENVEFRLIPAEFSRVTTVTRDRSPSREVPGWGQKTGKSVFYRRGGQKRAEADLGDGLGCLRGFWREYDS